MKLTLEEIARITGGDVIGSVDAGCIIVDSFSIDSRDLEPGAMFVAIRAERDGHAFVRDAATRGACAALVEVPVETDLPVVRVANTVVALTALALFARDALGDVPVVAITGSTGKTSTKDLTAAALSSKYELIASRNSFNNELGVPLTLLETSPTTGALVAEIGARGVGQVAAMATVVRHQVGVVTTIGVAHTELFGSVEDAAAAKAELLEALGPEGVGVVGLGHPFVDLLVAKSGAPVLTVGPEVNADVRFSDLVTDSELRPRFVLETPWGKGVVELEMRGAHQAMNAAMAAAAAISAGVSFDEAIAGMTTAAGSRWRMNVARTDQGVVLINDAYNANPASMVAALEALSALPTDGRRIAVLGAMAELGTSAPEEHRAIGRAAARAGVDRVIVVGAGTHELAQGAREEGCLVDEVPDAATALRLLRAELAVGDAVLVKASRVAGLEDVAHGLAEETAS